MASRTLRRECVRDLPWGFGLGRYERKQDHSESERSVEYVFLIGDRVQSHQNPHLYQTGSESGSLKGVVDYLLRATTPDYSSH